MIPLACTVIVCLTVLFLKHMTLTSRERRLLLNRIQAPQSVADDLVPRDVPLPQAVQPDDDAGYWKAQESRPETT